MPLLKFHLVKGRTAAEIDTLLDAAHDAMVASFGVPERDRYQVLSEHESSHVRLLDTGLGIVRTDKIVLIEVVSRQGRVLPSKPFIATFATPFEIDAGSTIRT